MTFEIDHVIARKHGGMSSVENLALSCFACNRYKGSDVAAVDPDSGRIVPLFHPRREAWDRHFYWKGAVLLGRTSEGRATIQLLQINHQDHLVLRQSLLQEGWQPGLH